MDPSITQELIESLNTPYWLLIQTIEKFLVKRETWINWFQHERREFDRLFLAIMLGLCKQFQRRRGKSLFVYLAIILTFLYCFFYKNSFTNSGNRIPGVVDGNDAVENIENIGKLEGNKHKEKLKVTKDH